MNYMCISLTSHSQSRNKQVSIFPKSTFKSESTLLQLYKNSNPPAPRKWRQNCIVPYNIYNRADPGLFYNLLYSQDAFFSVIPCKQCGNLESLIISYITRSLEKFNAPVESVVLLYHQVQGLPSFFKNALIISTLIVRAV